MLKTHEQNRTEIKGKELYDVCMDLKKRHWLDSDAEAKFVEIVEKYFSSGTEGYKHILLYADINVMD